MKGGQLFRVTAELDASTKQEFDKNICKGNKDIKIIIDYNGKLAKKTITYYEIPEVPSSTAAPF